MGVTIYTKKLEVITVITNVQLVEVVRGLTHIYHDNGKITTYNNTYIFNIYKT